MVVAMVIIIQPLSLKHSWQALLCSAHGIQAGVHHRRSSRQNSSNSSSSSRQNRSSSRQNSSSSSNDEQKQSKGTVLYL